MGEDQGGGGIPGTVTPILTFPHTQGVPGGRIWNELAVLGAFSHQYRRRKRRSPRGASHVTSTPVTHEAGDPR